MDYRQEIEKIDTEIAKLRAQRQLVVQQALKAQVHLPGCAVLVALPKAADTDVMTRINVLKTVREVTLLGLKEAKEGIEGVICGFPFSLGLLGPEQISSLQNLGCTIEVQE